MSYIRLILDQETGIAILVASIITRLGDSVTNAVLTATFQKPVVRETCDPETGCVNVVRTTSQAEPPVTSAQDPRNKAITAVVDTWVGTMSVLGT